jgi:hypothetical protein
MNRGEVSFAAKAVPPSGPPCPMRKRTLALVAAALSAACSGLAVAMVRHCHSWSGTSPLCLPAERFAAPGEMLWWVTLGGAFGGQPGDPLGIAVWIAGTALFWLVPLGAALFGLRKLFGVVRSRRS